MVRGSGSFGGYDIVSAEFTGTGSSGDGGRSMISRREHGAILAGRVFMLGLGGKRGLVGFARRCRFGCGGVGSDSAGAAVVSDVRFVVHDHRAVHVHVGDVDGIDVHDGGVVEESAVAPFSTEKADAAIAEAIVNATVKTDVRAPVTGMPGVKATAPSPVAGRP